MSLLHPFDTSMGADSAQKLRQHFSGAETRYDGNVGRRHAAAGEHAAIIKHFDHAQHAVLPAGLVVQRHIPTRVRAGPPG